MAIVIFLTSLRYFALSPSYFIITSVSVPSAFIVVAVTPSTAAATAEATDCVLTPYFAAFSLFIVILPSATESSNVLFTFSAPGMVLSIFTISFPACLRLSVSVPSTLRYRSLPPPIEPIAIPDAYTSTSAPAIFPRLILIPSAISPEERVLFSLSTN